MPSSISDIDMCLFDTNDEFANRTFVFDEFANRTFDEFAFASSIIHTTG